MGRKEKQSWPEAPEKRNELEAMEWEFLAPSGHSSECCLWLIKFSMARAHDTKTRSGCSSEVGEGPLWGLVSLAVLCPPKAPLALFFLERRGPWTCSSHQLSERKLPHTWQHVPNYTAIFLPLWRQTWLKSRIFVSKQEAECPRGWPSSVF